MERSAIWGSALLCLLACDSQPLGHARSADPAEKPKVAGPSAAAIGAKVRVSAGEVRLGFAGGSVQSAANLKAFDISKLPVTHAQYDECQSAGACGAEERGCEASADVSSSDQAALCVSPTNAKAYCAWVGGRLPTLAEWLASARGADVRRFAWGDEAPSCEQHPRGQQNHRGVGPKTAIEPARSSIKAENARHGLDGLPAVTSTAARGPEFERACADAPTPASYRVGRRPSNASPSGMQDALLLPSELVGADPAALLPACHEAECLVFGLRPGAIDSVRPFAPVEHLEGDGERWTTAPPDNAHALRCVWEAGS